MKKTDNIYIDGYIYFDESLNGWYKKYGSYEFSITFFNFNSELAICVKKYGYIIGNKTTECDVRPTYIENIIAKIICEENDNSSIDGWAINTAKRNYF